MRSVNKLIDWLIDIWLCKNDPGCTFGRNLQPGSRVATLPVGVKRRGDPGARSNWTLPDRAGADVDTCWWSAAAWSVDSWSLQSAPGEALNSGDVAVWLWPSSVIVLPCMTWVLARISASLRLSFAVDRLASATSASNCRFSYRTATVTRTCKTFGTHLLRQSTFPSFSSVKSTPERVDIYLERIYERRPRPLCPPRLITLCPPRLVTLQYHFLLRFFVRKLATTSDALKLWFI